MNRKVLLLSSDNEFKLFVHTAALTLTKLNHQIDFTDNPDEESIDLIIADLDSGSEKIHGNIRRLRNSPPNAKSKILAVGSQINESEKQKVFSLGCDAVMSKKKFIAASGNILIY